MKYFCERSYFLSSKVSLNNNSNAKIFNCDRREPFSISAARSCPAGRTTVRHAPGRPKSKYFVNTQMCWQIVYMYVWSLYKQLYFLGFVYFDDFLNYTKYLIVRMWLTSKYGKIGFRFPGSNFYIVRRAKGAEKSRGCFSRDLRRTNDH